MYFNLNLSTVGAFSPSPRNYIVCVRFWSYCCPSRLALLGEKKETSWTLLRFKSSWEVINFASRAEKGCQHVIQEKVLVNSHKTINDIFFHSPALLFSEVFPLNHSPFHIYYYNCVFPIHNCRSLFVSETAAKLSRISQMKRRTKSIFSKYSDRLERRKLFLSFHRRHCSQFC